MLQLYVPLCFKQEKKNSKMLCDLRRDSWGRGGGGVWVLGLEF